MIKQLDKDFTSLNEFIDLLSPSKIFILVDENTHDHCLPILLPNLITDAPFEIVEIEAGEENKNIHSATQIWEIFTELEADRKALLLNLGGGVVTDLGGFVASTYKRGISFINIPTTLLSICDASIGGKTGIDLMNYKNMVGTFAFPEQIYAYPKFLDTLPAKELKSGFAEMLKHGLIADKKHWEDLIQLQHIEPLGVEPFIERSMEIKQEVVNIDFHEKNIRKTLNFGHTIGHAIESLCLSSENPILHGEAVALGMICEAHLSYLEGLLSLEDSEMIIEHIARYFCYVDITGFSEENIFGLLLNDKKNTNAKINFSLLNGVGSCVFDHQCSTENIIKSLDYYKKLSGF